jgi:protein-S-isoprenylcysteine O-methyltransferase
MTTGAMHGPLFAARHDWLVLFWASYSVWIALEIWIFSRDWKAAHGARRDAGSLPMLAGLIVAGLILAFMSPRLFPSARMTLPAAPLFYAAILLILGGGFLRGWAVVTLGRYFRTTVFIHDDHRLIVTGPYRLLRHPAYAGALLTFAGVGLAMGNWISLAVILGLTGIGYIRRILVEEQAIKARFGEAFSGHVRQTWALIPFIW